MYYTADGEYMKAFNTRDAMGLERLRKSGVEVALMTGENSPVVAARAKKLGIRRVHSGVKDKAKEIRRLSTEEAIAPSQVAFVGDDINDLGAMDLCGFTACPADAMPEVRLVADYLCTSKGGDGAVREVCDYLLSARKKHPLEPWSEA